MAFNHEILDVTTHRPWPMPSARWVMTQTWHDLLFAHWPVDAAALRDKIPPGFELDEFERQAWVSIVPFHMSHVAPRGIPALPWISAFPELNVRTYVRVGGVPGVHFFSLDATNLVAVVIARTVVHLPYYSAAMHVVEQDGWFRYDSRRTSSSGVPAEFAGRYRPIGDVHAPVEGTLDYFLTERYCLFTVDSGFHACRLDIHHPPWPLQEAQAQIDVNTMAEAAGIRLPEIAPRLHFSRRQDVVIWMLGRV